MPDEASQSPSPPGLTKEQKTGLGLLFVFGILSIGLGVLQIRNTMYAPFALSSATPPDLKDQVNTVDALRYRDTDHDGLSDFDELYVYGTSPYLYDTFSYGMSDKDVVAKGLPRCPKGQDCGSVIANNSTVPTVSATATASALVPIDAPGTPPPDLSAILSDPAQIRQLLIDGGMDKIALSKISDKDLLKSVQEILRTTTPFSGVPSLENFGVKGGPSTSLNSQLTP